LHSKFPHPVPKKGIGTNLPERSPDIEFVRPIRGAIAMVAAVERFSLDLRVSMMKPPRYPGGEGNAQRLAPSKRTERPHEFRK
jgi:hypothetical protein